MSFVVGLSFGQQGDRAALAVIEETEDDNRFDLRHLECRRHDSYPGLITRLECLIPKLPKKDNFSSTSLALDATEVGRPIIDMIRNAKTQANLYAITVTGGDSETKQGWQFRLPERDLTSNLALLLQTGRLKIVRDLSLASSLEKGLKAFRGEASTSGDDGRAVLRRGHDDLVLAVALAAWIAEKNNSWARSMKAWLEFMKREAREASWRESQTPW